MGLAGRSLPSSVKAEGRVWGCSSALSDRLDATLLPQPGSVGRGMLLFALCLFKQCPCFSTMFSLVSSFACSSEPAFGEAGTILKAQQFAAVFIIK